MSISTIDIALFGNVLKTMEMTPKPGRGAGGSSKPSSTTRDEDQRGGTRGSVFVHVREGSGTETETATGTVITAESTSGGESTACPAMTLLERAPSRSFF